MNNFIAVAKNYIEYLKKFPNNANYRVAIIVINKAIDFLHNKKITQPTKEEIKITIDVIKDIKKSNARTLLDAEKIEDEARFYKFLIDTFYPKMEDESVI